jgi:hypothetical protein
LWDWEKIAPNYRMGKTGVLPYKTLKRLVPTWGKSPGVTAKFERIRSLEDAAKNTSTRLSMLHAWARALRLADERVSKAAFERVPHTGQAAFDVAGGICFMN